MDLQVTLRICDVCGRQDRPGTRYTLIQDDGVQLVKDLCDEDAGPVLKLMSKPDGHEAPAPEAQARPATAPSGEAKPPAQRRGPAKKATAKKTAAKKTATRRGRTPVKTLAEIEAEKAAKAKES